MSSSRAFSGLARIWQQTRARGAIVAAGTGAVLAASTLLSSAAESPFFCAFRRVTTVPCPSCGMTRAFVAIGHGDLGAAWHANLAGPIVYLAFAATCGLALAQTLSGRDCLELVWSRLRGVTGPVVLGLLCVAWAVNLVQRFGN